MHSPLLVAQLVAAFALVGVKGQAMFYKASATKAFADVEPDIVLGPFYIPDRQCSGVLYNVTRTCESVIALKVQVVDAVSYPEVSVDSQLQRATVRRRAGPQGCQGRVVVQVAVSCGLLKRSARALTDAPPFPQLPESRQLPPLYSPPPHLS